MTQRVASCRLLPLLFALAPQLAVLALVDSTSGQDRRGPFTTAPRSVRSRDFDQRHLRLEMTFDFDKQQIKARSVHTLMPFRPIGKLQFDATELKVEKVYLQDPRQPSSDADDRQELTFKTRAHQLDVTLDREYGIDEVIVVAVDYTVNKPKHGAHFVTPDSSEPDQPRMVWTQNEPEYAQYWFPCIDSPSDRLTSETVITVPDGYHVLSNGKLESQTKSEDGAVTWHWRQRKSHVAYLISVVAGDFEVLEQKWGDIPITSYVPRGRMADAARSFEKTPEMMQLFSQKIGYVYPWPKYAQICVDEYMWGGMEHTSATTLNDGTLHDERAHLDVSSDGLVAHELAHQWWGDLLTCKDWGELWLNESFATYFATLWTEHDKGWDEAVWERHQEAESYKGEDKRYRRPIVTYRYNAPGNMFDRHSYPKGGRVLHMLRYELGDDLFWRAINRYCSINQFRTVETADLRIAIEEATGQGMNWFFDQWAYHGGHPEFEVAWRWDDKAKMVVVDVKQKQKVDDMTPLFRTDVEFEIAIGSQSEMRRVTLTKAEETFHFQFAEQPTHVCFDPQDWILKTLTFSKSKEELLDQLQHDKHIMCRARAVEGLAEFKKDEDVLAALSRTAAEDEFWGVRQEAVKVLAGFNTDPARDALLAAATGDEKSFVRREAIKGLTKFKHESLPPALRDVVKQDASYYAVAEALKALVKLDRDHAADDLLAALEIDSDRDVVLQAACDGLITLKEPRAAEAIQSHLNNDEISPERRAVLIGALARLRPEDEESVKLLHEQLDNDRGNVRRAAIDALVKIGGPESIDALQTRRAKEEHPRMVQSIDEAIEKIRAAESQVDKLQKELDTLRKQNQTLEQRLEKLEKAS
ncbi:MAG: M1 family aminopeptidase [Pirellulaceae bacterium]